MTRTEAIQFAKSAAKDSDEIYTNAVDFEPHEWVIEAIMAAAESSYSEGESNGYSNGYENGRDDGSDDGYERGYEDGVEAGRSENE